MKSNGLLKWLMIPMALLVLFVGIKLFSGPRATEAPRDAGSRLSPEEMKALGIEGDTPHDTVATLVGQVKQLRSELQAASSAKNPQAEPEQQRRREAEIDQRIQNALKSERDRTQQDREQASSDRQQAQGLMQELQQRLEGLGNKGHSDLPVGLGLEPGDGKGMNGDGLRWIEPQDAQPGDAKSRPSESPQFPSSFGPAQRTLTPLDAPGEKIRHEPYTTDGTPTGLRPVYTVPANSTLIGSTALTALIGRVPIDGTVNDPYPFKVLIGADNLTANGIDIPDIAGAVVSGTASGDWTLSCVRGQVRSISFVFNDGTIRTLPSGNRDERTDEANAGGNTTQNGMGWISDPSGVPCVAGERRSNAQQYLGSQALITAAGAGAASLIKSDNGSVALVGGQNGSIGTVGISGNEAMGRILAGGVQEMSQWVNKLYGQAFAAVYVQPGAKVAVHLDQALRIDYDSQGRKVHHEAGGSHAVQLD